MENTDHAPRYVANAIKAVRDLNAAIAACGTDDADVRAAADHAADALYAAADALQALRFDEPAFILRRAAEVCTGLGALTLGAITRIDGEAILADTPYRLAMLSTMGRVADDLVEAALRDADHDSDNRLFDAVRALL